MVSEVGPTNRLLDGHAYWRHMANTAERLFAAAVSAPATRGDDAACYQITLDSLVISYVAAVLLERPRFRLRRRQKRPKLESVNKYRRVREVVGATSSVARLIDRRLIAGGRHDRRERGTRARGESHQESRRHSGTQGRARPAEPTARHRHRYVYAASLNSTRAVSS